MNSTLVFKSTHLKSPKHQNNGNSRYKKHNPNLILNTEHTSVKADSESKTVSYNEIIPDAILNEDINVVTEKNYIEKDYSNENYGTFPSAVVDNPWFSDHIHQNGDDPLELNPEDFQYETIEKCKFRTFNNVSIFSRAEFIHEYIDFRHCYIRNHPEAGQLDRWVRHNVKSSMGYHGEIIITTQFEFELSPPDVCTSSYNPTLLIVVFSKTAEERSNIRQTWAKVLPDKVKVIFVLGEQEDNNENLLQEFQTYGDILQTEVSADDNAHEFKQILIMISWIYHNCPSLRYVLKTTSDTYINVVKVMQLVDQEMYAANRIYGELLKRMQPQREKLSEIGHYISNENWPWSHFPPFLQGPSFIISGDVVPRLLMATTVIPTLPLAQVFFTGLVPLMGHLMRIGVASLFSYYPPARNSTQDPCEYSKYGGIHRIADLLHMQEAVSKVEESFVKKLNCTVGPRCLAMVEGKCMMFSKDEKAKRKNPTPRKWA